MNIYYMDEVKFIVGDFYGVNDYLGQKSFNNLGLFYSMDDSSSIEEIFFWCLISLLILSDLDYQRSVLGVDVEDFCCWFVVVFFVQMQIEVNLYFRFIEVSIMFLILFLDFVGCNLLMILLLLSLGFEFFC